MTLEQQIEEMKEDGFVFDGAVPVVCPSESDLLADKLVYGPGVKILHLDGKWFAYDSDNRLYLVWPDGITDETEITLTYVFNERYRFIPDENGEPDTECTDGWRSNYQHRREALRNLPPSIWHLAFEWYGNGKKIYTRTIGQLRKLLMDEEANQAMSARWEKKVAEDKTVIDREHYKQRRLSLLDDEK